MHDLDHLVAGFVNFDKCEDDSSFGEITHLVLDFEAIWAALGMVVTKVTDVFAVTWGVCDVESRLDAVFLPAEAEGFVKSSLDIFWEVTTSICRLLLDVCFDECNIIGKVSNIKTIGVLDVTVGDKANSDFETTVLLLDMVNDLEQSFLGALNP